MNLKFATCQCIPILKFDMLVRNRSCPSQLMVIRNVGHAKYSNISTTMKDDFFIGRVNTNEDKPAKFSV